MNLITQFAQQHPEFMIAIVWPTISALLVLMFKPRTPAEYAALAAKSPRLAAMWQLVGALGLDPVKATEALKKMVAAKKEPPDGPSAIGVLVALFFVFHVTACNNFQGQNALLLAADVAKCIVEHQNLPDEQVALVCGVDALQKPALIDLLKSSRAVSAHEAAAAAARAGAAKCVAPGQ